MNAAQIRTVTVIGAGTMGHGIAHVAAVMGADVRLYDALAGGAQAGLDKVAKNLANCSHERVLPPDAVDRIFRRRGWHVGRSGPDDQCPACVRGSRAVA